MHETLTKYRDSRWFDAGWLLMLYALTGYYIITSAAQLSATFDEPFYMSSGLEAWQTGSTQKLMRAGTMPLPVDVQTGLVYAWEQYRGTPFDVNADFAEILPVARAGNLLFWFILLLYGMKLGRHLGGPWAGRLAAGVVALDPNLLGHAALATTDISITSAMVVFVYYYLTTREDGWYRRVGLIGLLYGFTILTKASGLVFGPLCMVVLEGARLWPHFRAETANAKLTVRIGWLWRTTRPFRRDAVQIAIVGMVLVFAWCGSDFKSQSSFVKWAGTLPEGNLQDGMTWFATRLTVFPNAGEGLVYQIKHNFRGHGVYILGDWFPRAVWYYFPITLLIKLSLPVLALVGFSLLQPKRMLKNPIFWLVLALFAFSLNCRVQIGVRFMLPLIAFLLIYLAIVVIQSRPSQWPVSLRRAVVFGCFLAVCFPSLIVWPHGLCYANQLWGGPGKTGEYLADSNFDWGQGLKELAEWQKQHPEAPLHVWYFGTDPAVRKPPHHLVELHQLNLRDPAEVDKMFAGSYLAVGTSLVHNDPRLTASAAVALENLRQRQPVARTMTFLIYSFP